MTLDPQDPLVQWLKDIDISQPLAEIVDSAWLEEHTTFTPDELMHLKEDALEYAQELFEQRMIADLPPIDMPDRFFAHTQEQDLDFGR